MITALIHLFKHPNVRRGNKVVWVIVVVFVNIFGPILYFLIGRGED
ncbi:PLDc N-terminal domain-containing protein [Mesobacillus zeae]|nr:PLDc N-terminal domain-containing protein [Mesobacillus zeae]